MTLWSSKPFLSHNEGQRFLIAGTFIIPIAAIEKIDISEIEQLRIKILHGGRWTAIQGIPAIDAVYLLKPSALEGKKLRWIRHAWAFHNLIAHPLMQLFAFLKRYDIAFRIHDATIPYPYISRRDTTNT